MPLAHKPGDDVKIKRTTLDGKVIKAVVIDDHIEYAVMFTDHDDQPQTRYFTEEQLDANS